MAASASVDVLLEQAMALHRDGRLTAAESIYRQILGMAPSNVDALHLLGVIEYQFGHFEAATERLRRAVAIAPGEAGLHCNLGLALQQLNRLPEALACQDRALALRPGFAAALNNRGNVLRELGRPDEAAASYEGALRSQPEFSEALYNLGRLRLDQKRSQEALECLRRCLKLVPDHPSAQMQTGVALLALKQPAEALDFLERAVRVLPDDAEAHYYLANALLDLGRPAQAVAAYQGAARLRPDFAEAHYNLANTLLDLKRPDDALLCYQRALATRPGYVEAAYNLGGTLQELGRHEEAAVAFERLIEIAPGHRYALGKLFHSLKFCCDWSRHSDHAADIVRALNEDKTGDAPFSFLAVSQDPALQLRCARAYTDRWYPPAPVPLWSGEFYAHDRIRVAYVSTDFREHPVSYLLAGLFEAHDRQRFETVAISLQPPDGSALGQQVAASFERFIDGSRMSDRQVATLIRELEVDIAVDLTGYTENNRTAIFAHRPAPIQVNYLGFPGTMGAGYMDYIIADEFVIPEAARRCYAEQVAYLPDCFQGNDDRRLIADRSPSRAELGLPDSAFVFCAFNNVYKFSPDMFDVWMRLLRAVPDSVLWIAADTACVRRNLAAEAVRRGIDAERLVFSPRVPYAEHLARLRHADLFLDTLPFNAGTTASDALWAGLPVLTCVGESFAARMAGSLLRAVGLPELITDCLDDYETLALRLATTPALLVDIRCRLAENRASAPLFDTDRFRGHLEAAYTIMLERHRSGATASTFTVSPMGTVVRSFEAVQAERTFVASVEPPAA